MPVIFYAQTLTLAEHRALMETRTRPATDDAIKPHRSQSTGGRPEQVRTATGTERKRRSRENGD